MSEERLFSLSMVRICIDESQGKMTGRAYSKLWPTPLAFSGLGEMVLGMDRLFDKCGYPQAFQERRSFRQQTGRARPWRMPEAKIKDAEIGRQQGERFTFDIVVQSRRQAGWQGLLMRTDRTILARFNSEMELLDSLCVEMEKLESEAKPLTG